MTENPLWTVPVKVDDVSETGRQISLSATAATRAAIAAHMGVQSVQHLDASFEIVRRPRNGLRVVGEVKAVVEQLCVVTLEPLESTVIEKVDVDFLPPPPASPAAAPEASVEADDLPEFLVDGAVDLGALAIEFLILGVDPYPRKPGAKFIAPAVDAADTGPFATLAKLKQGSEPKN
jgi:uncharacterized metal-binding protein YceD (DUF177 family)